MGGLDPIALEVIASKLNGIVDEMQQVMFRTGYSTIIRESKDASAGITDSKGRLIGQAVNLPLHIGVFTPAVEALFRYYPENEIREGDVFIVNHPYIGGSPHAPDIIVMTPVFSEGRLFAMCCNIAHKPDIGGSVPGSTSGNATEIFQEGLHLPPVKYYSRGKLDRDVDNIIRSNSRVPDVIIGDLRGQVGCTRIGSRRLEELLSHYGSNALEAAFDELLVRTKTRLSHALTNCPEGEAEAEGYLDPEEMELDRGKRIHVKVALRSGGLIFDFRESDDQARSAVNVRPHLVRAACHYSVVAFTDSTIPPNHALFEVVKVITKTGTILDPKYPAPVSTYSGTLQFTFQVILRALSSFFPDKAVAGGGHNRGVQISGSDLYGKSRWAFYEILGSGQGARAGLDGLSGASHYMSNVALAPIEIIESEYPIMVTRFELVKDSGGSGKFRGGIGFRRVYRILHGGSYVHRTVTYHVHPPWGLEGGKEGRRASYKIREANGEELEISGRPGLYALEAGDSIVVEKPGGGGYGDPYQRDPNLVRMDVLDGYVSTEKAMTDYGVEIDAHTWEIDWMATVKLRTASRGQGEVRNGKA